MNSIWNKNIAYFKKRFPSLAENFCLLKPEGIVTSFSVETAKNGEVTATENGLRLHSSYNPSREATQIIEGTFTEEKNGAFFYGFGMGWLPLVFAQKHPDKTMLIVEPNPEYFFQSMLYLDWTPVFNVKKLIIAISCPPDQVIALAESFGLNTMAFFWNQAYCNHNESYFSGLKTLVSRNLNKDEINRNTKKRFGKLWERNARMNLSAAQKLDGVNIFRNYFKNASKPFVLIAAGPSLETILPYMKQIAENAITVCVDTALRALLKADVEPDFIVLTDPQFWAYMHIAGLQSEKSILIADAVSYPAVFRFQCRKIVISSSPFPIPEELKDFYSTKGDLGSGGSVATVAWNFCEFAGAKEIYTAGLDLSFSRNQTHIRGSTYEEAVHRSSNRIDSGEKATGRLLFSADISKAEDYNGNIVLTDSKMKMFAWWFESRIAACPHVKTFTLCPESMKIPGITSCSLSEFFEKLHYTNNL